VHWSRIIGFIFNDETLQIHRAAGESLRTWVRSSVCSSGSPGSKAASQDHPGRAGGVQRSNPEPTCEVAFESKVFGRHWMDLGR